MKKLILILLFFPILCSGQFKPFLTDTWANDTWGGQDKTMHFTYCTYISMFSGGMLKDGCNVKYGYEVGIVVAIGVGIWKESIDDKPSYKDLTFDVLGALAGYGLNLWYQKGCAKRAKRENSYTLQRKNKNKMNESKVEIIGEDKGHGICKRCKTSFATVDYNGYDHWVCDHCDKILEREFEEEYQ